MSAVLAVEHLDLSIRYAGRNQPILRDINLELRKGEVHGLVGESGAGKSMLGRVILDIMPSTATIDGGCIYFNGKDWLGLSRKHKRRYLGLEVTLIPQDPLTSLNPVRRIKDQIEDTLRYHLKLTRSEAKDRAFELLEEVHVRNPERVLRQFPHELSGGMRQRVLIAIAFCCQPALIIADEPTTALDVSIQRQILRLIRELQINSGTSILFITHDLGVVAKICDHVSLIHTGRILESGSADKIFGTPEHEYSRALIQATPRYDRPSDDLIPVPAELTARLRNEAHTYDQQRLEEPNA
jgi:peptide/nickel transport system ATP-binding protein